MAKMNDIVFNSEWLEELLSLENFHQVITLYDLDSETSFFKKQKIFFVKGANDKLLIKHFDNAFDLKHNETLITTKAGYFKEGIKVGKLKKL